MSTEKFGQTDSSALGKDSDEIIDQTVSNLMVNFNNQGRISQHPIIVLMSGGEIKPGTDLRLYIPSLPILLEQNKEKARQVISGLEDHEQELVLIEFLSKTVYSWQRGLQFKRLVDIIFDLGKSDVFKKWFKTKLSMLAFGTLVSMNEIELALKIYDTVKTDGEVVKNMLFLKGSNGKIVKNKNSFSMDIDYGGSSIVIFSCGRTDILDLIEGLGKEDLYRCFGHDLFIKLFKQSARSNDLTSARRIISLIELFDQDIIKFPEKEVDISGTKKSLLGVLEMWRKHIKNNGGNFLEVVTTISRFLSKSDIINYKDESLNYKNAFLNSPLSYAILYKSFDFLRYLGELSAKTKYMESKFKEQINQWINLLIDKRVIQTPLFDDLTIGEQIEKLIGLIENVDLFKLISEINPEYKLKVEDKDVVSYMPSDFLSRLTKFFEMANLSENMNCNVEDWVKSSLNLFNSIEEVGYYVRSFSLWAGDKIRDLRFYNKDSNSSTTGVYATSFSLSRNIIDPPMYSNDRFFELAFDFKIENPLRYKSRWVLLMINYPEISRYLSQANELESYMSERGIDFPDNINIFKELVLDYNLTKIQISDDSKDELKRRLYIKSYRSTQKEIGTISVNEGLRNFDIGVSLNLFVTNDHINVLRSLIWLGVLENVNLINMCSSYVDGYDSKELGVYSESKVHYKVSALQYLMTGTNSDDYQEGELKLLQEILIGMNGPMIYPMGPDITIYKSGVLLSDNEINQMKNAIDGLLIKYGYELKCWRIYVNKDNVFIKLKQANDKSLEDCNKDLNHFNIGELINLFLGEFFEQNGIIKF